MDKKKFVPIVVGLVVLLIILMVAIVALKNNSTGEEEETVEETVIEEEEESYFELIDDYQTYYTVKNILSNYTTYIKEINGDTYMDAARVGLTQEELESTMQEEGLTAIKNILDEEYISDMQISDSEIIEKQAQYTKVGDYSEEAVYNIIISSAYTAKLSSKVELILVNAMIDETDFTVMIKMDTTNGTYSMFYDDYLTKYGYDENTTEEELQINSSNIEANNYNLYTEATITEEYLATQYYSEYKSNMLYNTEQAYYLLDEEYREAKYGSYEAFASYVSENEQTILTSNIEAYQINETDEGREYVCIDQNGKYYVFIESSVSSFDVVLDIYTIDLPSFKEQYNSADDPDKAGLNLQKIVDAINDGGYEYIYSKLDETFKQNNFPTIEEFETYIQSTFYSSNDVEFSNYRNSSDLHIFDATFTDEDNAENGEITKTFILQLEDGTDFRFSFNV